MLSTDALFYLCAAAIFLAFYASRSLAIQTIILSVGSFAMYATEGWWFLLLLLTSCALNAICSYWAASPRAALARAAVIAGVVVNLAVLAIFKYKTLLFPAAAASSPLLAA
jgi:D-alanyl-lipoteichoic acid acyltransferase DltB (MBOAT superfamily)